MESKGQKSDSGNDCKREKENREGKKTEAGMRGE